MHQQLKRLLGAILVGSMVGLLVLPAISAADNGQAATHTVQTFTRTQNWFGPDDCTGKTITGVATETGTTSTTTTGNGGIHEQTDIQGTVDLFQANGPGPGDPQPGAFIGTWTYQRSISDQAPPDGQGSTTGITSGLLVFPDGTSARRQVMFHITWDKDPLPPKLFFAKFMCSGN